MTWTPERMTEVTKLKVEDLYLYAKEHVDGFTYQDVQRDLGWPRREFFKMVHRLRRIYREALICTPQGQHEPYLYQLVTTYLDAEPWGVNRTLDCKERLRTINSILSAVVPASDGRTKIGKQARVMRRTITRLLEDLEELEV